MALTVLGKMQALSSQVDVTVGAMTNKPRPGWHGIAPSRDRFVPPISLPAPTEGVTTTTQSAPPVWVDLVYSDGHSQTVKGFAMAWTNSLVLAQWVEYSMAREAWVNANVVSRRKLEERRPHRDG